LITAQDHWERKGDRLPIEEMIFDFGHEHSLSVCFNLRSATNSPDAALFVHISTVNDTDFALFRRLNSDWGRNTLGVGQAPALEVPPALDLGQSALEKVRVL
jgi:hypothetical protein